MSAGFFYRSARCRRARKLNMTPQASRHSLISHIPLAVSESCPVRDRSFAGENQWLSRALQSLLTRSPISSSNLHLHLLFAAATGEKSVCAMQRGRPSMQNRTATTYAPLTHKTILTRKSPGLINALRPTVARSPTLAACLEIAVHVDSPGPSLQALCTYQPQVFHCASNPDRCRLTAALLNTIRICRLPFSSAGSVRNSCEGICRTGVLVKEPSFHRRDLLPAERKRTPSLIC